MKKAFVFILLTSLLSMSTSLQAHARLFDLFFCKRDLQAHNTLVTNETALPSSSLIKRLNSNKALVGILYVNNGHLPDLETLQAFFSQNALTDLILVTHDGEFLKSDIDRVQFLKDRLEGMGIRGALNAYIGTNTTLDHLQETFRDADEIKVLSEFALSAPEKTERSQLALEKERRQATEKRKKELMGKWVKDEPYSRKNDPRDQRPNSSY